MAAGGGKAHPRRRLLGTLVGGLLALVVSGAVADQVDKLVAILRGARAYKVRLQAATVLAKLDDPRVVPALGRTATGDRHPFVRIFALRLLARGPGGDSDLAGARAQIRRALQDRRSDVRAQATRSLAELDRRRAQATAQPTRAATGPLTVFLGSMGDRSGQAGAELRARLKAALLRQLRAVPTLVIANQVDPRVSYIIDATIARLTAAPSGTDMEITCAIQLLVSRPPRGIVMVASGEASVLKPRSHYRPATLGALQAEALDHAVASAYENLGRFLKGASH